MINAHTPNQAATGAAAPSAVVRLARHGLVACALVFAGLGAAQAQGRAQYRDDAQLQQDGRGERFPQTPREAEGAREQRFDPRSFDTREFNDVRRRNQQAQQEQNARNAEAQRRSRMTPDERRDLRRQINEAGMDLYPSKQQH